MKNPSQEINSADKRFDITSFPAAYQSETFLKKPPIPSKHRHPTAKIKDQDTDREGNRMDFKLKQNDESEAPEDVLVDHPLDHMPWFLYMHRPLYPFHRPPRYFSHYIPYTMRFSRPTYWNIQGYFPHFMTTKIPWGMSPSDMSNIHHFPEYQYGDVQFIQSYNPFGSKPAFRDYSDLSPDNQNLEQPEELQGALMHSKTKINSHNYYDGPHEEDRKMVDNSEDSKEGLKSDKIKEKGATESVQGTNTGAGTNQAHLNLNPTVKEDEATNYPEYASEFNTDRFWSSAEKRQRNLIQQTGWSNRFP